MASLLFDDDTKAAANLTIPIPTSTHPSLTRQLTGSCDDELQDFDSIMSNTGDGTQQQEDTHASSTNTNTNPPPQNPYQTSVQQPLRLTFNMGGVKDEGVKGKENQDDYFLWNKGDNQTYVIAVLDGHGRELGKLASKAAKDSMYRDLTSDAVLDQLRTTPQETMADVFRRANDAIRTKFLEHYASRNVDCKVEPGGFLVKRTRQGAAWNCVHGGTTASVVVVLDGSLLISANVGDSTAMTCNLGPSMVPATLFTTYPPELVHDEPSNTGDATYHVLSAEHSPETPSEYVRMREQRPCPNRGGNFSEMLFVYDAPSYSKYDCPDVFHVQGPDGTPVVTNNGRYYKSVRNEWATLVTTPPHARFQDALAFTRSCGDLHLQTYGVSCVPDVSVVDLQTMFAQRNTNGNIDPTSPALLLVCSDGVWDNWKFQDVVQYFKKTEELQVLNSGRETTSPSTTPGFSYRSTNTMDGMHPDSIMQSTDDVALGLATRFMNVNKMEAHKNFGNSADNMTAVVCTVYPSTAK